MSSKEESTEFSMRRFEAQSALFAVLPKRLGLVQAGLRAPANAATVSIVNVWRNHNFETLEPLISQYCAYRSWNVAFKISSYDESLSFTNLTPAAAHLLWIDSQRSMAQLPFPEWLSWFESRIKDLRKLSVEPIIVATWLDAPDKQRELRALIDTYPSVYFADIAKACAEENVDLLDSRSAAFAGTPISSSAQTILARKLACHWLPGILLPPIKAIAVDLDNTLHSGVLGEDGALGVHLSDGHICLQNHLKVLKHKGIFIGLVSRNERRDVEELFSQREDFPLRLDDFSAVEVSWEDKAKSLQRIADELHISTDSILFVDDNPGELMNVVQKIPVIQSAYAHPDAHLTTNLLNFYPGLWRWSVRAEDRKRVEDMKAAAVRKSLLNEVEDRSQYFSSLKINLRYFLNPMDQMGRLADLSQKTNQFNLAIQRLNEAQVENLMSSQESCIVSVELSDRLSESGIIALVAAKLINETLIIEELCISCRAIGRGLEDSLALGAIQQMPIFLRARQLGFKVVDGPRNQPALAWLSQLPKAMSDAADGSQMIDINFLKAFAPPDGISIIRE